MVSKEHILQMHVRDNAIAAGSEVPIILCQPLLSLPEINPWIVPFGNQLSV